MKATFVALTVAGLAVGQNLSGISPCVAKCIEQTASQIGCTGTKAEFSACLCKPENQARLVGPVTQCATSAKCSVEDLLKAQSIAAEECKPIESGSGSATGSSTEVATGSTTGNPSSLASASASSTAAAITTLITGTGGAPTHSQNQTVTSSSGATGTTKAPTTSHGGSGSATTSGSGTVPTTTGAAAAGPVVGALAAVLAAALAL